MTKLIASLLGGLVVGGVGLALWSLRSATVEEPGDLRQRADSSVERSRRDVLNARLAAVPFQLRELPNGYSWTYDEGQRLLPIATEWIGIEARRCPFLDLSVAVIRDEGPLVLKVSGKLGVKPFLKDELGPLLKRR